jgi:D-alanyl-D-alanine carboxypeptidase (penicillin-binding protein 5/6)
MRLSFLLLCFVFFFSLYGKGLQIDVSARSAILMNADTGHVLFEKNAYAPSYPASTTKIATALFVLDGKKAELGQSILVSEDALRMKSPGPGEYPPYWLDVGGTMMGIKKGEILPLESLLHGMMMISGNDAANAIAESLSGSIPEFMEEVNGYLRDLGCLQTHYRNPHGLHDSEHMTSAHDLALMLKKGLGIPAFRELISKVSYLKPKSNKSPSFEIITSNPLIKPGSHYDSRFIGGKTGYTSKAMATLVTAAESSGRTLIAIVLGCSKTSRYEDVKKLFNAAFQEIPLERLLIQAEQVFTQGIENAEKPFLSASLQKDLMIRYFPSEESQCRAFIHWNLLELPIQKGQMVGEVRVIDASGRLLAVEDLLATEDLQGTVSFRIKKWFSEWF